MEENKTTVKTSLGKSLIAISFLLVISIGLLEILSVLIYPWLTEISYSRKGLQRSIAAKNHITKNVDVGDSEGQPSFIADHMLHPYAGFTNNPEKDQNVNEYGFWGPDPIIKPENTDINICITGGSVALQLYQSSKQQLIDELQKSEFFAGKKINVITLAVNGYKQPQQLLTLSYMLFLGAQYDIVINLDGFNEIVLPFSDNLPNNVFPFYPRIWNFYSKKSLNYGSTVQFAKLVNIKQKQENLSSIFSKSLLNYSNFCLILWNLLDNRYEQQIQLTYLKLVEISSSDGSGSGALKYHYVNNDQYFADQVDKWARASRQIHNLGVTNGFTYFHFLQPNQYVKNSKVFSEEEKQIADVDAYKDKPFPWHPSIRAYKWPATIGYPHLKDTGGKLKNDNVNYTDLTMIFKEEKRTVYGDACCHFYKLGYDIVAAEIGGVINEHFRTQ